MDREMKRHYTQIVDFLGHILGPDYEVALHGGVGQQQLLLRKYPLLHGVGAFFVQHLLEALPQRPFRLGKAGRVVLMALGIGRGHLNLRNVFQHAGGPVPGIHDVEQLRCFINEFGMALPRHEGGMGQNIGDEGNVGLDAADMGKGSVADVCNQPLYGRTFEGSAAEAVVDVQLVGYLAVQSFREGDETLLLHLNRIALLGLTVSGDPDVEGGFDDAIALTGDLAHFAFSHAGWKQKPH